MTQREKLIEEMDEMLEIIAKAREEYANDVTDHSENEYIREGLINANYRKQSEGEWEKRDFIIFDFVKTAYRCTSCNTTWDAPTKFCPNCGAHMRGGKNE
jgi:rubrerythrin